MKKANEPAFPSTRYVPHNDGLTRRELFAAMAMQGIIESKREGELSDRCEPGTHYAERKMNLVQAAAWGAVEYADALIAQLEKEKR